MADVLRLAAEAGQALIVCSGTIYFGRVVVLCIGVSLLLCADAYGFKIVSSHHSNVKSIAGILAMLQSVVFFLVFLQDIGVFNEKMACRNRPAPGSLEWDEARYQEKKPAQAHMALTRETIFKCINISK